ncbi:hypothetical protein [Leptolyngbya sp. FACHB-261]|uniref:hypothetical protein n=1 Tax=Leptolyngbya sp. FACHB-261 TaxID=2692806 RepID=UPI001685FDD9|nr:hypothetical protein [Leptolyngbya sp. FACHB-261]MBD2104747.1 hypothetical protein [Leptolyngbya sp. FACHB-261]
MLTPLRRTKIEEVCPLVPTGDQYQYYWGTPQDVLRRVAVSCLGVVGFWILSFGLGSLMFLLSMISFLYWLWGPIYWAAQRNRRFRAPQYAAFWQGEVVRVWGTEEIVEKREKVNDRGRLVVSHERKPFLNLEIGDKDGFWTTALKVPFKPEHRQISRRQAVCCLLMSDEPEFERINRISDAYLPDVDVWVSDYPYLRRDVFGDIYRYLTVRSQPIIDLEME